MFDGIIRFDINTVEYKPLEVRPILPFPKLLSLIQKTPRSVSNGVYSEGITDLKQNTELTFGEIEFPVKLMHFTKFEKLNPRVPGINVFGYEDREKRIFPL